MTWTSKKFSYERTWLADHEIGGLLEISPGKRKFKKPNNKCKHRAIRSLKNKLRKKEELCGPTNGVVPLRSLTILDILMRENFLIENTKCFLLGLLKCKFETVIE